MDFLLLPLCNLACTLNLVNKISLLSPWLSVKLFLQSLMKRTKGFRKNNLIYEEIHKNECLCCSINNAGTEVTLVSLKVRIKKTRNSLLHCEKIAFLHIVVVVDYVDIMSAWSPTTPTQ